jgi:ABC-type polar amino acid transport system ATPase subunit
MMGASHSRQTSAETVIELRDIHLSFGPIKVLRGIDLEVIRGERIALLGPSGSGKSSLVRCINGLCTPDRGEVRVFGEDISAKPEQLRKARRAMEMIFQGFNLYSTRTVMENVTLAPMRLLGMSRKKAEELAFEQLRAMDIDHLAGSYPFQLSGGEQQRVALARALAKSPEILLLDEPTSALDPELVQSVLLAIERATDGGMTTITVTHEIGFARRQAHRAIFMSDGVFVEEGKPREMFSRPRTESLARFLDHVMR